MQSGDLIVEQGAKILSNLIPATAGVLAGALGGFDKNLPEETTFNTTLDKNFPLNFILRESESFPLTKKGLCFYYIAAAIANPQATIIEFSGDVIKTALTAAKMAIPKVKKQESNAFEHAFQQLSYTVKYGAEKLASGTVNTMYFIMQCPRSLFVRSGVAVFEECVKKDNNKLHYVLPFTFIHILGLAIQTTWIGFLLCRVPAIKRALEKYPNYNLINYAYKNYLQ